MLKIRLQRVGRKHISTFRVVVTDARNSTKSGRYLEVLGFYDPVHNKKEVKGERVKHWLSVGAEPSVTLRNFFIDQKIIEGKKVNALPRKRPVKGDEKAEERAPAEGAAAPSPRPEGENTPSGVSPVASEGAADERKA